MGVPEAMDTIETDRLVLRGWRDDDAPALYALCSDPRLGDPAGFPAHRSVEDSLRVIRDVLRGPGSYAIELKGAAGQGAPAAAEGPLIGAIGLKDASASDLASGEDEFEVGYWTGVPFQGRGYMTEALRALVAAVRDHLDVHTLWCAHYVGNSASRHVMENAGFVFDHTNQGAGVPLLGERRDEVACRLDVATWDEEEVRLRARAVRLLERQERAERFLPVSAPLRLGRARVLMCDERLGVLARMAGEGTYYGAPFCQEGAERMRALLEPGSVIFLSDASFAEQVAPGVEPWRYDLWEYEAAAAPASDSADAGLTMRPLTVDDADTVEAHYSMIDHEAVIDHLARGWIVGAYDAGALVGFIGEHDEATMGMLEVFPEARRHGYATLLEAHQIGRMLAADRRAFCHVACGNAASQALQRKLGLRQVDVTQCWVEVPTIATEPLR